MSGFLLARTDQRKGYVAAPGHKGSYTHNVAHARVYPTREAADADRCEGNEVVVPLATVQPR